MAAVLRRTRVGCGPILWDGGVAAVAAVAAVAVRARFDRADDHRHIATRIRTVGEDYAAEAPLLRRLPGDGFETGRHLRALLRADEVVVFDRRLEVARHERSTVKGSTTVVLDHYLEILVQKPAALPGAVALDQARRSGVFTAGHEAFWAGARAAHGDAAGTRELVEVLLLHRHLRRDDVLAGLRAATSAGATRADVVAVEARRLLDQQPAEPAGDAAEVREQRPVVVSLTQRRLADSDANIAVLPPGLPPAAHRRRRRRAAHPTAKGSSPKQHVGDDGGWGVMSAPARRRKNPTEHAATAAIDQACRTLRLPTIRGSVEDVVATAEHEQLTYRGFLAELLLSECDDRDRPRSARRVKAAGFPREKWLEDFDYDANPSINPATIHILAGGEWVRAGHPLCPTGNSGTGKSHLLIVLGTAAAHQGRRVHYTLARKLVNELVEAADEKQLAKTIASYGRVDLLCIDELGYMQLDRRGAEMLLQVLTEREETNSIAIASNQAFSGWTNTFTDPRLCAAIIDRLTFAGPIIETGTQSCRLAHARARRGAAS